MPRVFDHTPLKTSVAERRLAVAKTRKSMRQSPVWLRCKSAMMSVVLCTTYTRPVSKTVSWGMQAAATMPGDVTETPAARAADVAAQMNEAFSYVHPMADIASRLTEAQTAAVEWQCRVDVRDRVAPLREQRFSTFAQCARELEGWTSALGDHSPPWVTGGVPPRPHYALFDCCIEACGLPDTALVEDLIVGAQCTGECPDSGMFRADWQPAALDMCDLDHEQWHRDVHRQLRAAGEGGDKEALERIYERTQEEVADGWATPLGSLEEAKAFFGGQPFREMVRFAVEQDGKIRPCDNGRSSLHNLATTLFERLAVDSADFPARAAAMYAQITGDTMSFSFHLGTEDVASAYRRMPCCEPWYTVFAQLNPHTNQVEYYRLEGFNFGVKSAVNAFNRLAVCMREVANRVLAVCCSSFFDDFCVAEPSFAPGGQQLLREMAKKLRLPFAGERLGEHKKSIPPAARNTYLGVEHDFRGFVHTMASTARVRDAVIKEVAAAIGKVLEQGSFADTAGPLKLAGQLQFTVSWSCRRFGKAATQPLHKAARRDGRYERIDDVVRAALTFIRDLLVDPSGEVRLRPRRFQYKRKRAETEPHVIVWSDACWEPSADRPAGIGFVVFFPATDADGDAARGLSADEARRAARSYAPSWLDGRSTPRGTWRYASYFPPVETLAAWRARRQYIGQLELLAAITVYYSLASELRGKRVVHYIDNSGAMASLVKDYSSDLDSAQLVNTFYALACGLDVDVWFDFVKSEANIADWPSRGEVAFAADVDAARVHGDALRLSRLGEWGDVSAALAWAGAENSSDPPAKKRRVR